MLRLKFKTFDIPEQGTFVLDSYYTEMEFKEFEPRFKSAKTRFKLSAGLNIETFNKWSQPYLNRGLNLNHRSNYLNSATGRFIFISTILYSQFLY